MLSVTMKFIMLNVVMLNAIMPNVIILKVVAPGNVLWFNFIGEVYGETAGHGDAAGDGNGHLGRRCRRR